jgi:hypothetical protein
MLGTQHQSVGNELADVTDLPSERGVLAASADTTERHARRRAGWHALLLVMASSIASLAIGYGFIVLLCSIY